VFCHRNSHDLLFSVHHHRQHLKRGGVGFAGIPIGLGLTLIHLVSIPVTNTSVNPARSTDPALVTAVVASGEHLARLWLFWLAPLIGAVLAGLLARWLHSEKAWMQTQP
jgi:aquaporin Z